MRKSRQPKIILPGLFWDGERFSPASLYPRSRVYTDKGLARLLMVSQMRVQTWRTSGLIPFRMMSSYAEYDVNSVIKSLQAAGYRQDETLKSKEL